MRMTAITYKDMTEGPIEICRDLCNDLMAYQTSKARRGVELIGQMSFENRLKPEFADAPAKSLTVAYADERPVGYAFSTATVFRDAMREPPAWAKPRLEAEFGEGLWEYPEWLTAGTPIGLLDNLYVEPGHRGEHIGERLIAAALDWLTHDSGASYIFVDVSNGNNAAPFYERNGFRHSHAVYNGFLETLYMENRKETA
jgi:GNAT superfamily N-acetyltransferase